MKLIMSLILILSSASAMATEGIHCESIYGELKISTSETKDKGDNVLSLTMNAPWIQKDDIQFLKSEGEVNVDRKERAVYMASNSKGQSVTLVLYTGLVVGLEVSTAYVRTTEGTTVDTAVFCD